MKKLSLLSLLLLVTLFGELTKAQEYEHYADTPDTLLPYGQFLDPYLLFFNDSQPYLGSGRDDSAPADLETVKIGFVAPLEGSNDDEYGQGMLKGAMLALEEANAKGGYHGLPYELLAKNDVGLWGSTGNEVVDLYDEGAWAVIGSIDGNNSHVALRVILKLEMPMVNTTSTDPTLTETRIPWMIRCVSDDRQNSYAMALHIFEEEGLENVAILRADDRYGRMGVKIFLESAIRLGHPVRIHMNYIPGANGIEPQLEKIRNSNSEAVVIWGNDEDAAIIINRMRELGMNHKVFGSDRLVTDKFLELTGKNAEGVVTTFPYNPQSEDSTYLRFVENYRDRYNFEPDLFAAHTYDGMKMLIQSIERGGLNRVRIRDELTSIETYHGVTGDIILDTTWNDIGKVWLMEVENGNFVAKYPSK